MMAHHLSTGDRELWCAVSLLREKKGPTVASSSAQALDETQNRFRDGPCLTAIREHTVVRMGDVRSDGRWSDYLTAATGQGVAAVLGVAFELDGQAKAGLNIYSRRAHDFGTDTIETIQHEVVLASKGLRLAVRLGRHREAEADLQAAMASSTTIDLAVGTSARSRADKTLTELTRLV